MTEVVTYKTGELSLCPISVKEEYRAKWNIGSTDFLFLVKDGDILNNTLYRIGGLGNLDLKADYFMLLKYIEAFYPDEITKYPKRKPHLESKWVIIDKHGKERVEFGQFQHPSLIKNSIIYSNDREFFNIETGECYGKAYSSMESSDYLFIDRAYDSDKEKRGVLRINKKDGTTTLYK